MAAFQFAGETPTPRPTVPAGVDQIKGNPRVAARRGRLEVAVEAAQESVELVRTQYIEGLTDFQSYLDAERVLFEQQDALAKSRGDVFNAYVGLNRALGGGWSPDEPEPDLPPEVRAQASTPPTAEVQDDAQGEDR